MSSSDFEKIMSEAKLHLADGMPMKAIELLRRAVTIAPANPDAKLSLGKALFQSGISMVEKVTQEEMTRNTTWQYAAKENPSELRELQRPFRVGSAQSLGILEALKVCRSVIELRPNDSEALKIINRIGAEFPKIEKKSSCFIATAVYGHPLSKEVFVLRKFRDNTLLRSSVGKLFVKIYEALSPPIAYFIQDKPTLRELVRQILVGPIVSLVEWSERR